MKNPCSSIEILEARVAPASLTGNFLTYTDLDGDAVKITFSGATASPTQATFSFNDAMAFTHVTDPMQLELIDLAGNTAGFANLSITVAVTKAAGGDGLAHLGLIDGTNVNLNTITTKGDLGGINAGTGSATPAIVALKLGSMGRYGLATQGGAGFLESDINGSLTLTGSLVHEFISVTNGTIGAIKIGGSLLGGPDTGAGSITASGDILGPISIGKDLIGGAGVGSGQIHSSKNIAGPVTIKGSLLAGPTGNGGQIFGEFSVGAVTIGGDVRGGDMAASGFIRSQLGAVGDVTIAGSLIGGKGNNSGALLSALGMGVVKIGKHVEGGGGAGSGSIGSGAALKSVTIGGTLRGGDGQNSGEVSSQAAMGAVKVGGDVIGGNKDTSAGRIYSATTMTSATVGGSLIGGAATSGATIFTINGNLGPVKIAKNILGGSGTDTGAVFSSSSGDVASVSVGGSIRSLVSATTSTSGVYAQGTLGPVTVKGDLQGTPGNPILILGSGALAAPVDPVHNVAIKSLTVGGSVEYSNILAGLSNSFGAVGGNVEVGAIKVGGNWIASNFASGARNLGADDAVGGSNANADNINFGDAHDFVINNLPAGYLAEVKSIAIKGAVIGTGTITTDHFGFVAKKILSFKVGGVSIPFHATTTPVALFGYTGSDVSLHAVT